MPKVVSSPQLFEMIMLIEFYFLFYDHHDMNDASHMHAFWFYVRALWLVWSFVTPDSKTPGLQTPVGLRLDSTQTPERPPH